MPNIATLILAAGASRRLGRPKQLLPWGKTTLIQRAANAAAEAALGTNATNTMHSIAGSARPITIAKASVWIVRRRLGVAMECMAAIVTWAALQS